ncbi:MAG: hypothetical protein AAF357_15450 [Verrucomicrobiota bacterium]
MSSCNVYPPEAIALRFRFLDQNPRPVDPGRVVVTLKKGGTTHTFVYLVNDNLTREDVGIYRVALQFLPNHSGNWDWHVEGGSPGDDLVPAGYLKAARGQIKVSEAL